MSFFYTLNASEPQQLRRYLQQVKADKVSSLYQLTSDYPLTADYSLTADYWLMIQMASPLPAHLSFLKQYHVLGSKKNSQASAQEFMLLWAFSELEQTKDFIAFEDGASNEETGCSWLVAQQQVFRCYRGLSEIMLIINQTPDSFSERGQDFNQLERILLKVKQAVMAGVTLIDVGGESTRPGAEPIEAEEEIRRLQPLIERLVQLKEYFNSRPIAANQARASSRRVTFKLSLDSCRPATVLFFLAHIDIINDVSGNLAPEVLLAIIKAKKIYIFMHSLTIPADSAAQLTNESDPVSQLLSWGRDKLSQLLSLGFAREQLILDVGIGFNKSMAQSWYLIRNIAKFHELGLEVLVGHSRKRFIDKVSHKDFAERDLETAMIGAFLQQQGVAYLRVHEYRELQLLTQLSNQLVTF